MDEEISFGKNQTEFYPPKSLNLNYGSVLHFLLVNPTLVTRLHVVISQKTIIFIVTFARS